jgi:hypothetical protein
LKNRNCFITLHSFRSLRYAFGVAVCCALAGACVAPTTQPAAGVTFIVPVPTEVFSPKTALQVSVWNAQQLKTLDQQAECAISHDVQTGAESIQCPEGVTYQEIKPEGFVFPIQAIKQSIHLTSQTVKIGEKYQIVLRGLSSDGCNSTSATAEGTATTSAITLGELGWATTVMACVQP